ncbi:MAG: hypothetical protein AAGA18_07645 [Verrucomicrobiota bacterium]
MKNYLSFPLLLFSSFFINLATISAQVPQIDQSEQARIRRQLESELTQNTTVEAYENAESIPEIIPGEEQDIGPQYLMSIKPRKRWVEGYVDSQYYYTSNVFLSEDTATENGEDTGILVSTIEAAFAPDPWDFDGDQLYFRLGFRHQWYNYGLDKTENGLNDLDFDSQTVFTQTGFRFHETWFATVGFDWQRLLGHDSSEDDYAEFYKEYVPSWSLEKQFPISDDMLFTSNYEGRYYFTEQENFNTETQDRTSQALTLAYLWTPLQELLIQTYYRFEFSRYTHEKDPNDLEKRLDWSNSIGMGLYYLPTEWLTLRTFISYDRRDSDRSAIADYDIYNAGGGISCSMRY